MSGPANHDMMVDHERFESRHIGPGPDERDAMLKVIGAPSLDVLMDQAIPARIRRAAPLNLPEGLSEQHRLRISHVVDGRTGAMFRYEEKWRDR